MWWALDSFRLRSVMWLNPPSSTSAILAQSETPLTLGRPLSRSLAGRLLRSVLKGLAWPPPSPDSTSIALWWRAADAQALYEQVKSAGVRILRDPIDGPFGRTFAFADPDGYRITIYEKDQPLFWPPKP